MLPSNFAGAWRTTGSSVAEGEKNKLDDPFMSVMQFGEGFAGA